jgi:hypothetical protein
VVGEGRGGEGCRTGAPAGLTVASDWPPARREAWAIRSAARPPDRGPSGSLRRAVRPSAGRSGP